MTSPRLQREAERLGILDEGQFTPEIRRSALWSGDSRRIASGDTCGVVLEKLARLDPEDLSEAEEVQMGKRLQPVVARIFEDVHNVKLKELKLSLTHPRHVWMKSHFDYVSADGGYLVECKNYNAAYASAFSEEGEPDIRIPDAERAQCLHEACVYGVDFVWLAILFGGQRYRDYRLYFSPEDKEAWIKRLAEVWGNVQTNTIPPPATTDQARAIWPMDDSHSVTASKKIEHVCHMLGEWKASRKLLDDNIEAAQTAIMDFMGPRSSLIGIDGKMLATWKTDKPTKLLDKDLLQQTSPELYEVCMVEKMGARRFLLK
jgi:predicted phage-related endonuclease